MSIINYSRNQYQPEILYLPLEHGGFIQLQEGAHVYPNHAAYGLKNSTNVLVRNYLANGSISIMLDAGDGEPVINEGTLRTFAPLDDTSYNGGFNRKLHYAPINSNRTHVTTAEILENPNVSVELKDELSKLLETSEIDVTSSIEESRKTRRQKVQEE